MLLETVLWVAVLRPLDVDRESFVWQKEVVLTLLPAFSSLYSLLQEDGAMSRRVVHVSYLNLLEDWVARWAVKRAVQAVQESQVSLETSQAFEVPATVV